jgi:tetratricopeptide (TPR) repeat protein
VKEAEKLFDEAGECFNKAVTTAPKEAEAYFERAVHRSMRNACESVFRILRGELSDRTDITRAMFTPDSIPDFREVVRLSPKDPLAIGGCAFFEAWSQAMQKRAAVQSGEDLWNLLPDETRQSILGLFARLEDLSGSSDPRLAAGAFTSLAVARAIVRGDFRGGITHLRRALALAPSSDLTMDLLISLHVREARFDDLLPLCEERVKRKDTSHNRGVLAKVYDKLNQTEKAEAQLRSILTKEPDNIWANLALASLLLKRDTEESTFREAARAFPRSPGSRGSAASVIEGARPRYRRFTRMFLKRTTLFGSCACSANVPSAILRVNGLLGCAPGGSVYSSTVSPSIFTVTLFPCTMMCCVHHLLSLAGVVPRLATS